MSWVKWTQICKPKNEGGLGIKNLYLFNLSLLTKWRWRLLTGNNSALWERVLVERYGTVKPWFGNPPTVNSAKKMSLWWRDLAKLGDDTQLGVNWFKSVTKKRVGSGNSTKFWFDIWLGREPLADLYPSVMARHRDKEATIANLGDWTDLGWKWQWSTFGLAAVFDAANDSNTDPVFIEFVDFMQGVQLNLNEDDRWIWLVDIPGGFSVKSCYGWMCKQLSCNELSSDDPATKVCKSLWKNDIPSKVLVFCWRLLLKKLPTRDNLLHRGILSSTQDSCCVFCHDDLESVDHLFCGCTVTKEIWRKVFMWLNEQVVLEDEVVAMFDGVGRLVRRKNARRVKSLIWAATTYQVWMARNKIIFNNLSPSVSSIVTSIKLVSWGWFISRKGRNSGLSYSDWFHSPMGCILSL